MNKLIIFLFIIIGLISCEKETSVEGDGSIKIAIGTLTDSLSNCKPISIKGSYEKDSILNLSHSVVVNVNFIEAGNYTIYSDTINGIYFKAKAFAFVPGIQNIVLQGYGKVKANVDANFKLRFGNSVCFFTIKKYSPILINGNNDDYFPTTNFSNWVYDNSLINDTSVVSVTGLDKNIGGYNFRKFLLNVPKFSFTDTLYYRKDGVGNYYKYDTIGNGLKTEFVFLKDYHKANDTFSTPEIAGNWQGTATNVKYFFTMLRKNVKRTYNTMQYDSVIIMQQETQYLINGAYETKNTFEFSYSKKVGLVNVQQIGATINLAAPIKRFVIN